MSPSPDEGSSSIPSSPATRSPAGCLATSGRSTNAIRQTLRRERNASTGGGMAEEQSQQENGGGGGTAQDSLSVTDNRTGETYEVEVNDGTVTSMDFRGMKVDEDDFGLMTYDPAFTNTAHCRSAITYIDGEAGVLEYRGYTIEELCEKSSYLEVAYLLIDGGVLPDDQLKECAI